MDFTFIIPVAYEPEDNNSYIGREVVLIKDCNSFVTLNQQGQGYNVNKCPNDDCYFQPFIKGDIIYHQIIVDTTKYVSAGFELIDLSSGQPFEGDVEVILSYSKYPDDRNLYFSAAINTTEFDSKCWYLKIILLKEDDSEEIVTSEPYTEVKCNEETIVIEGSYDKYDCNGVYYDDFEGDLPGNFKLKFRVRGTVEPNGYSFDNVFNGNTKIRSTQSRRFTLFTEKVPSYVAEQIAAALNSESFKIDDIEYKGSLKLDKNFDEGSGWIIKEDIFIDCDEINFSCK